MSSRRELKRAGKNALQQREVILELNALVKDIERCERTITDLQRELAVVNSKPEAGGRSDFDSVSRPAEAMPRPVSVLRVRRRLFPSQDIRGRFRGLLACRSLVRRIAPSKSNPLCIRCGDTTRTPS